MCLLVAMLAFTNEGIAGQERYDYDPIGRLTQWVDSRGNVTQYTYDPAGNILSVMRGSTAGLAPQIASVSPGVIRGGQSATFTITGQRLQSGVLRASDPGIDLTNVRQTANQILVDVEVATSVPTGNQSFTFTDSLGTAVGQFTVAPKLPTLSVEPNPLALPPDNTSRAITVRLSGADLVAHTVTVASNDANRATISPANIVFAPGQTTAQAFVTPKAAGFVTLSFTSTTLASTSVPLFVTSDFRGVNTSYAQAVGVQVGPATPAAENVVSTVASQRVGLSVGPVITSLAPSGMPIGASQSYTLIGSNLPSGLTVGMLPPNDVSANVTASNNQSVTFTVDAAAAAAIGVRSVVVKDAAGNVVPFADPAKSQIQLTTGQPSISSIEPLFGTRGKLMKLLVRGTNLQQGKLVISPSIDLAIDADAQVNAAGTELTANLQISQFAALGPRTVQVVTPSGQTSAAASSANQFAVVAETRGEVNPIFAPLVGVRVGTSQQQESTLIGPIAASAGVVVGPYATATAPSALVVGTSGTLTVSGAGLQAVQSASLNVGDGVTFGTPSANAQGTTFSIPFTVAVNAPRSLRRLNLTTASGTIPFVNPGADLVRVVNPSPELNWVAPQVVQAGQTVTLTARGTNFTDLVAVRVEPATGATVTSFATTDGGTTLTITLQTQANAPSGTRTLIVDASGGSSSGVPSPANTFQIAQQVGPTYSTIFAPLVGVQVQTTSPQVTDTTVLAAPLVGVVVDTPAAVENEARIAMAPNVGVVVGAAVSGLQPRTPDGVLRGAQGVLTVSGFGLGDVTGVTSTAPGLVIGSPVPQANGTQVSVPVTVPTNLAAGVYGIGLQTGAGASITRVTALDGNLMTFSVGDLPTALFSMSPIVLEQGKSYTFTVRGSGLKDVFRLEANPPQGVTFVGTPQWATDTLGEKLTVSVQIDNSAPIGSRVVQLQVPGGITGSQPTPANTITIVAPQ
jgi:YD repeat-containing protein